MSNQKNMSEKGTGTGGEEQLYSVGAVCELIGTTRKTLFYYDRIGLLTPTRREGEQHYKQYDEGKIQRLRQILRYRDAGLHISEIRALLDGRSEGHLEILQTALSRMRTERTEADEKIRKLEALIADEQV